MFHQEAEPAPQSSNYSQFLDPKHSLESRLDQLLNMQNISQNDITEVAQTIDHLISLARALINEHSGNSELKLRICFEFVIRDFRAHLLILNDSLMTEEEMRRGAIRLLYEAIKEMDKSILAAQNSSERTSKN